MFIGNPDISEAAVLPPFRFLLLTPLVGTSELHWPVIGSDFGHQTLVACFQVSPSPMKEAAVR